MGLPRWLASATGSGANSPSASRQPSASQLQRADSGQSLLYNGLGSLPSEVLEHPQAEERRYIQRRIQTNPMWTLDRGTGFYVQERLSKKKASLLGSGSRNAGKSTVAYEGIAWTSLLKHVWRRDFFTTAVHARFQFIVAAMIGVFLTTYMAWAVIYYAIWLYEPRCFIGFKHFLSAFLFSIETQNTIGYGSHAIGDCWLPAWLVGIQCILAVLLEAIFLGIIFAKISHPKGRSRTILISECACIARRDGILKFMFRVADIRKRTAIAPRIMAHLYTWGPGHKTAEGEYIPVQVQELPLHFKDATLLLPIVVEHTIDERSPLYGHTAQSLEALGAEVVVTFEGSSELGDAFMSRRSYLPSEVHWGCTFVNIITHAESGSMAHQVDLARFHEVEPQDTLAAMPPARISRAVVMGGSRRIPRARLGENTLQLADELVITRAPDGTWFVAVRVGDSYPSQMCSARVQMFVYRYNVTPDSHGASASGDAAAAAASGGGGVANMTYVHQELPLTRHLWRRTADQAAGSISQQQQHEQLLQRPQSLDADPATSARMSVAVRAAAAASAASHAGGGVNVLLRYPVVVGHEIGPDSPIRDWVTPDGMLKDADAEIVVVTTATMYISSQVAMRSKVYAVLGSIRWGHSYAPCVLPPNKTPTGHAMVDWSRFHDVVPSHPAARKRVSSSQRRGGGGGGSQQPTPQHSLEQPQGAWFGEARDGGGASSSGRQQQEGGRETFESQLEEMLGSSQTEQSPISSWQQRQQQSGQAQAAAASRSSSSRLSSVVVHDSAAASTVVAEAAGGVQSPPSSSFSAEQQLQFSQETAESESGSVRHAHSLGFSHFADLASMQAALQQERQQREQRRQQQGAGSSGGGSGFAAEPAQAVIGFEQVQQQVRQGISSAAQLHAATGQQASQQAGGGPSVASAMRYAVAGGGFAPEHASDQDLTATTATAPRTDSTEAPGDRRSLSAVMELFAAAGELPKDGAAGGGAASGSQQRKQT